MGANYSTFRLLDSDCGLKLWAHKVDGVTIENLEGDFLAHVTGGITTVRVDDRDVKVWAEKVLNGFVFAAWRSEVKPEGEFGGKNCDFVLAIHVYDDYGNSIERYKQIEKSKREAAKQAIKLARKSYGTSNTVPIEIRAALGSFFATDRIMETKKE